MKKGKKSSVENMPKIVEATITELDVYLKYSNGIAIRLTPAFNQRFLVNFSGVAGKLEHVLYGPNQVDINYQIKD